mmetsp:Transcript_39834/g.98587  ORF Transcript_39834/g.98587 Transcript_39834/m.98587 type:complete len:222 (+) Transcript_39834:1432-2097(+)
MAALRPSLANSSITLRARSSNSALACFFCSASVSRAGKFTLGTQSYMRSILLSAMMNGVLRMRSMLSDSSVCGSSPCMMSTTRMARSHKLDPRLRRLVKDSWPGVSITSRPGTFRANSPLLSWNVRSRMALSGMYVAPICCVMPPASPSCTLVRRMLSRILVLPVSTWPRMQITGHRSLSLVRSSLAVSKRALRAFLHSFMRSECSLFASMSASSEESESE